VYGDQNLAQYDVSRMTFIRDNLFNADILRGYGKDMAMFFVFAALGIFSTLRRLLSAR
jgi:hypothetical protein